jgi:DNA-binding MarR family transcriptional regulator
MPQVNWQEVARGVLHPLQVQVIERAAARPDDRFSPAELANEFDVPLPNLAYHVRILSKAGWIVKAGTAPRRGAIEHFYKPSKKLLVR